jgi:protocatechuate 3,4-dioxygenase beta subunit
VCSPGQCVPTPPDTIDFLPPIPENDLPDSLMCSRPPGSESAVPHYYGFDSGVPPLYSTLIFPKIKLFGTIKSRKGTTCDPVSDAVIDAWHVDPHLFSIDKSRGIQTDPNQFTASQSLRAQSCRGKLYTDDDGSYSFSSVLPPSYGPPRHVNVMVSAAGYETLITRIYFADDWRLLQLSILHGEENQMFVDRLSGLDTTIGFPQNIRKPDVVGTQPGDDRFQNIFPGNIGRDPRVIKVTVNASDPLDVVLLAEFNIFLKPLRDIDSLTPDAIDTSSSAEAQWAAAGLPDAVKPPLDLSGLWSEETGGLVAVETKGNVFVAAEYPHPRRWGTVFGSLFGDTIRGVDFRGLNNADAILSDLQELMQLSVQGEIRPVLSAINSQLLWESGDQTSYYKEGTTNSEAEQRQDVSVKEVLKLLSEKSDSSSLWSTAMSTGVVAVQDPFNTDPGEMRIEWSGGSELSPVKQYWSKHTIPKTFRY